MTRRIPEIAAFLVESPRLSMGKADEIAGAVFRRWPGATCTEIELAVEVAFEITAARAVVNRERTERERLIERARLFHGAQVAAELLVKYRPDPANLAA